MTKRQRIARGALAAVLVLCLKAIAPAAAQEDDVLVIRAGTVIRVDGDPISPGAILARDGKIVDVGRHVDAPVGARVIDVPDGVVMPGVVAAYTTLAEGTRDVDETATPELRIADGLDLYGDWRSALSGGVTTAYLSPPGRRVVPGQGAVAKLGYGAPSARVLDAANALRVVLGDWPKNAPDLWDPPLPPTAEEPSAPPQRQLPTTRAGEMVLLRELLGSVPADPAIAAALAGELPVRIRADRAEDIRNALALADEFGLRIVIEGGREAYKVASELAERRVPVVLLPTADPGGWIGEDLARSDASGEYRADNGAVLAEARVPLAISSDRGALSDLLPVAAWHVGQGMPEDVALRGITMTAAEILGVSEAVGSIDEGKDADLVVLSGQPLGTTTRVLATVSDGRVVYEAKSTEEEAPLLIVRAQTIHLGTGGYVEGGELRIRDGKVQSVGPRREPPEGARVIDLEDRAIMPGLIDTNSHLGLHWESDEAALSPSSAVSGPSSGGPKLVSVAYAVDPTDEAMVDALRAGVTAVVVMPGDTGQFCGGAALVKTAGADLDARIVAPIVGVKFSMGGATNAQATPWQIRELLDRAKSYHEGWVEFDNRWTEAERRIEADPGAEIKEPSRPRRDGELELMRGLFTEGLPALVVADRQHAIEQAAKVFGREYGLNLVIVAAGDAFRMADDLAQARVHVVLGPSVLHTERGRVTNIAAAASQAGVPVAFQSASASGSQFLRLTAAQAVRHGMTAADAIRALTCSPAEMLGMGHRLGSLEPGRDADFVVFSGAPLELTSRVEQVYVNGELAYDAGAGG